MAYPTIGIAIMALAFFVIRYLNSTDTPKVKNLPEIPGVPIFGNLLQLGQEHARIAGEWAKKYGPVFQVRLGNRVQSPSISAFLTPGLIASTSTEDHLCQYVRKCKAHLD